MKAPPTIGQSVKLVSSETPSIIIDIREGENGTQIRVKYPDGMKSEFGSVVFYDEA